MKSIHLKSDSNVMYTIDPVEETAKKEVVEEDTHWSVNHELKDHNNKVVGDGLLIIHCPEKHEHLPDKKMFSMVVRIGAIKIKNDIEDERELADKKYEIKVANCLQSV